jgi:hypothetical protein
MARKRTSTDPIELMERLTGLKFAEVVERVAALSPREFELFSLLGECESIEAIKSRMGDITTPRLTYIRRHLFLKLGDERHMSAMYWLFRVGNEIRPDLLDQARRRRELPAKKDVKNLEEWR